MKKKRCPRLIVLGALYIVLPKCKRKRRDKRLTGAQMLEYAKMHQPPQSWYDEDQEGLY